MKNGAENQLAIIMVILLAVVAFSFVSEIIHVTPFNLPSRPPLEKFLWTYRGLDVIVQGFIVFAAAAAVSTLFRVEKGPGAVEEVAIEAEPEKEEE
jgi:hypothetical protein